MISQDRIDELQFRADHNGNTVRDMQRCARQGIILDPAHATMIPVSPSELRELLHLRNFKQYVHDRLDEMGVPMEVPESEHTKAGCRIGGRLDFVEANRNMAVWDDNAKLYYKVDPL